MIDLERFMCLDTYFSIKIWVRDYTLTHAMQESDDVLKERQLKAWFTMRDGWRHKKK